MSRVHLVIVDEFFSPAIADFLDKSRENGEITLRLNLGLLDKSARVRNDLCQTIGPRRVASASPQKDCAVSIKLRKLNKAFAFPVFKPQ